MKATQQLHALGQSLWLDNITREMLVNGTLRRYIDDFEITGLTSNPAIFDHAIRSGHFYDDSIRRKAAAGQSGEDLFIDLALEDLAQAADLFRPAHEATGGVDGWVSMEVSPLLADDTAGSIEAAKRLHARGRRNARTLHRRRFGRGITHPVGHCRSSNEVRCRESEVRTLG